MWQTIQEGQAKIKIPQEKKISKALPVFYNHLMKLNRDLSILILNALDKKNLQIALPLAGTGIRGIRFLLELKKNKIKKIYFNDKNKKAVTLIKNNLKLNKIKNKKVQIENKDANQFLLQSKGFDYIDIDPFGSPNFLLNNAIVRLARKGILVVTATDTAPLAGTYPSACQRKYWAKPLKNELKHEIGLRILIRKIQLIGTQFEKALTPIFSYYQDHYYRIFFQNQKSKQPCHQIIKQHQYFLYCPKCLDRKISPYNKEKCSCQNQFLSAGPLWTGSLFDKSLINKIKKENYQKILGKENIKFLETIFQEAQKDMVGFYDLHKIAKVYRIEPPKTNILLKKLKALPTHFSSTGIKTEKNIKEILKTIK